MSDLFTELDAMFDKLYIPYQAEGELSNTDLMARYPQLKNWQQASRFMKELLKKDDSWKSKQVKRYSDGKLVWVIYRP